MDYTGNSAGQIIKSTQLPDDGTEPDAADVNVPLETTFDNFAFIEQELQRLNPGSAAWTYDVEIAPFLFHQWSSTSYTDAASGGYVDIIESQLGDVLLVWAHFSCGNNGAVMGLGSRIRLHQVDDLGGTNTEVAIPGARAYVLSQWVTDPKVVTFTARTVVTRAGTTRIKVQARVNAAGEFFQINSSASILVLQTRVT
jgi:hypothetical protein